MADYLKKAFGLSRKRAVVTGAGRGIGKAIAEALAESGAEVLVHYNRSKLAAEKVAEGINSSGGKAWTVGADLTMSQGAERLLKAAADRWGAIDILVNNSGGLVRRTNIEDFTDELIETVLRVNIHTALYCSRAAIPLLRKAEGSCIVSVGSMGAHTGGGGGGSLYCTTKGAIHTLTRGLAMELAPEIRVNAVAPGVINTDFHRIHSTKEKLEAVVKGTPLKRLGEAEDIAGAVVFLCGAGASFITGEVIEINGGFWVA